MKNYIYTIVSKTEIPPGQGRWQRLFDNLPDDKAVRFEFDSPEECAKQQSSLLGSLRYTRNKTFRIRTRKADSNIFFAWKEMF